MVAGRRSVGAHDSAAWVYNRIAHVYDARPLYPIAVVDAVGRLAGRPGARIGDIGAGTGHLALPLAARGFDVTAVEPHASEEAMPLEPASLDIAIVADAVHFLDAELTARELSRVLAPQAALALMTSDFGDTPFMRGIVSIMESAAPRRPRDMAQAIVQLFATSGARLERTERFSDDTPVDDETLEKILRSISFIGPAMTPERFTAFHDRIRALPGPRIWTRTLTLHSGRRR